LDHADRLGLLGRVETQALMWEPAIPLERAGEWVRIALPLQPDASGAPVTGWVIADHLTNPAIRGPHRWIVVTDRLAPARGSHGWVALSIGTLMPAAPANLSTAHVLTPDGQQLTLDQDHVADADPPEPVPSALAVAAKWLAVPYLWGGLSGHGVDCSGLVHLAARTLGHVFPRNAADQSQQPRSPFQEPLHFYNDQSRRRVRHVAIGLDQRTVLHAPRTGRTVEIILREADPNEPDNASTLLPRR
jgi:cell wall-associated NlpC family hydrolase